MSRLALKAIQAAAGNAGESAVYVDDVFSTYLYEGTNAIQGIPNGINLGDLGVGTSTRFNGTGDHLSRSSDLTGNADGKTFTFSCWVFLPPKDDRAGNTNQRVLYATDSSDNGIAINVNSSGLLGIEAGDGSGSWRLQATASTAIGTNVWTHILVSVDMANSSNRYVYLNDVAASVTWNVYTDTNLDFTRSTHYIGVWGNGTARYFYDDMAHFYLDYTYRDLSTESNRRIFIDANGGSTSASSLAALNPIMYLPMTTAYAVGKNAGTGGDFTSNGSPTIVENGTEYVADSGKGGMVWSKARDVAYDHGVMDTERGVSGGNLQTNDTLAAQVAPSGKDLTGFTSNGYTIGPKYTGSYNNSGSDYVSWTFRKQPGFFDVVTYTGTGSAQNISHNLGSVPGCIIIKNTSNTADWTVYHRGVDASAPEDYNLALNKTDARDDNVAYFNDTAPTSTVFTVNSDSTTNTSGDTYVAYLFAHDAQDFGENSDEAIIKCGSYTGNSGSQTIDVGFEAQWVLIKNITSGSTDWFVVDVMRRLVDTTAVDTALIRANEPDAEQLSGAGGARITTRSTGFGFLSESNLSCNRTGETYIYVAIRRPHKPASEFAATDLFDPVVGQTSGKPNYSSSTAVVDAVLRWTKTTDSGYPTLASRLTDPKYVLTSGADAEANYPDNTTKLHFAMNDGWGDNIGGTSTNVAVYMFRRAPGFFDVVTYTGNGSGTNDVSHNLGVKPELVILKSRTTGTFNWPAITDSSISSAATLFLNTNSSNAGGSSSGMFTDTIVKVGSTGGLASLYGTQANNSNDAFIMYLFATVAGISKVGTYSGTGSDVNVDCGFSAGARLVLVKRSDSTGDWYVWDAENGIVAGDDPYKLLNSSAAQVTNTDYIDPLSSGFTVTSSAPAALNTSGGTYIFYAIA